MWDRLKVRLCLVVAVATLASACTDSGGDVESTPAARELMEGALSTQAVQDFVAVLDLSMVVGDELVSITDQLVERARSGVGQPLDLAGGFKLTPTGSIDARAVDSDGNLMPTVSVDFGLLEFGDGGDRDLQELLSEAVGGDVPAALADDLFTGEGDGGFLIQIVSASYDERWAHVGPDDSIALDLSFAEGLDPGGELLLVHLFGQTLPGDPGVETGMSAHELFAYRWNQGLVGLVGGGDGAQFVIAHGMVSGGSTPSSKLPGSGVLTAGIAGLGRKVWNPVAAETEQPGTEPPASPPPTLDPERPGPQPSPSSPPAEKGPLAPGDAIFAAKTFERARVMADAYLAGEARARELIDRALSGTRIVGEPGQPWTVQSWLPVDGHCIAAREYETPDEMAVKVHVGMVEGDSCVPLFQVDGDGYAQLLAIRLQHAACNFYRDLARLYNKPESRSAITPDLPSCSPPRPRTAGGGTVGDVHMVTFDGLMFDNQAAGEFLLYDDGEVEVQMRTEPWPLSDVASVVTAAAVGVGDARVSMHEGGATFVDGAQVTLERGTPVELGAGSLLWTGVGWVVVGPDGTEVHVADNLDVNGTMHIIVHPKGDEPTGMLGTVNGDQSDDLVTRSGEIYPVLQVGDTEAFYSTFIDFWRITEDESLFHYQAGESNAGFQLEDFPARWIGIEDLDQDSRNDAETVCREGGLTRGDLLAACIYDIVVTGDPGFAYDAFVFQETLPAPKDRPAPTSPSTSTPPPSGGNFLTVGGQTFAFEGFADPGSCSISEESPGVSLPGFLGEAITVDAAGREVAIRIEFYALDDPFLVLTVLRDGRPYAWMWEGRPESGSVDEASMAGNSLTVTGTAFLNDPENPELHPMIPLPAGTPTVPFHLQATCDR